MNASVLPQPLQRFAAPLLARLANGDLAEVVAGAATVMGIRIGGAFIVFLSQILLARWMGAFEYGVFAYVWVWVIILGILAPMGFGTSTLRFVPDYRVNAKWRRLAGILDASWRMVMIFGLAAMALGLVALALFHNVIAPYYLRPLAVALVCVPVFALGDTLEGTARAFGWVALAYLPAYILRPLAIIACGGAIYFASGQLTGLAAVGGALVAALLTLIGQKWVLRRRIAATIPAAKPIHHTKRWILASLPLVLTEGLYLMLLNSDIVLLGVFVDPDKVGIYFAATRIVNLVTFIYFAVAALAVPKFSELHAKGEREALQVFVHNIIQWIFWPTLAAAIFILLIGKFALGFFGPDFSSGYSLLAILMIGFLARASTGPIEYLLNMTGHQNATAVAYAGAAALNIALNLVLIPRYGLEGAAAATAISLVSASVWLFVSVKRRLEISAFVFSFGGSRGRAKRLSGVEVIDSADALTPLMNEIEALASATTDRNPLFESAALQAAMRHLKSGPTARVALVRDAAAGDGALIGAFPYQVRKFYLGLPVATWTIWTHVHSFLATPLVRAGREHDAIRRFMDFADGQSAALVRFPLFQADGAFGPALDDVLAERRRGTIETGRHERAFLDAHMDGETYLATHMRKKKRKEYNRLWNRLGETGALEFTAGADIDFDRWLENFFALERSGWKGKRGTALAEREHERLFFETMCRSAYGAGRFHAAEIMLDGKPIAMLASFVSGRGAHSFKIAYDEDFARYSPGALLMMKVIGAFHDDPRIDWVDSCAIPNHPMIDHIWAERRVMRELNTATHHRLSPLFLVYSAHMAGIADNARSLLRRAYHRLRKEVERV